jgi:hypothetical protein
MVLVYAPTAYKLPGNRPIKKDPERGLLVRL